MNKIATVIIILCLIIGAIEPIFYNFFIYVPAWILVWVILLFIIILATLLGREDWSQF